MEKNDFTTIYLTDDIELCDSEINMLEECLDCEISRGFGFINVQTKERDVIQACVDLLGDSYIKEIK